MLPVAIALLLSACSKSDSDAGQKAHTAGPTATPELSVPFGEGSTALGRDIPEEGSPEGPTAFVVDASGRIHVLDGVSDAIKVFEGKQQVASVALPSRPFDDLELLDDGSYALLDLHSEPGITFVTASGKITALVQLDPALVPEPSLVTALTRIDGALWVEVEDERLVKVATLAGTLAEPEVADGKLLRDGATLGVKVNGDATLDITESAAAGETAKTFAHLTFPERVAECTLLASGPNGRVLVVARLDAEQADPEQDLDETQVLVSLDPSGKEQWRSVLPPLPGLVRSYRPVRVGADGNVYALTTSDTSATIVKVTP